MIDWNDYYRWAISSPSARAIHRMGEQILQVSLTLSDSFTPAVIKIKWAFVDFAFAMNLGNFPRWQWPYRKAWHWIVTRKRWLDR